MIHVRSGVGAGAVGSTTTFLGGSVPPSVLVYNACVTGQLRGTAAAVKTHPTHVPGSLRSYATERLHQQQATLEHIDNAADTSKLVCDGQLALASRNYGIATALLRRAAELGSPEACTFLAHLFGFGMLMPSGLFLLERDSVRGVAWAVLALHKYALTSEVSMLEQTLTLLCTLLCAPALLDLARVHDAPLVESALELPRTMGVIRPRKTDITMPGTIWDAVDAARGAAAAAIAHADTEPEPDEAAEHTRIFATMHTGTAFLSAYLATRRAFVEHDASRVRDAYRLWSDCVSSSRSSTESPALQRIQSAAVEGQQWAAGALDGTSDAVSSAEAVALYSRIGRIFPYAPKRAAVTQSVRAPPLLHRKRSSAHLARRHVSAPAGSAGRLPVFTPSSPATAVTAEPVLATGASPAHAGTSSTVLRSVAQPDEPNYDDGGYLAALHARPRLRRRPSSVLSVTPSLMFPEGSRSEPAAAVHDETDALPVRHSPTRGTTARLRRQASSASLRK